MSRIPNTAKAYALFASDTFVDRRKLNRKRSIRCFHLLLRALRDTLLRWKSVRCDWNGKSSLMKGLDFVEHLVRHITCALAIHVAKTFFGRYSIVLYISMLLTIYYFNAWKIFLLEPKGVRLVLLNCLILSDFIHPPTALAIPVMFVTVLYFKAGKSFFLEPKGRGGGVWSWASFTVQSYLTSSIGVVDPY